MEITYFNGSFIPKEEVKISPEDRGFYFAEGVYEVVRWYEGLFYDMKGHSARLKRSLGEIRINWPGLNEFQSIAEELIRRNSLQNKPAMVYFQVTRGAARRTHYFPSPDITPTVYANSWGFTPDTESKKNGIKVLLKEDIRWSRCDIKSIALLPNTLCFQEAYEKGLKECIFIRNGLVTEGSHSNIFFVIDGVLYTHPETNHILPGITRKNVLRIAHESGVPVIEEAVQQSQIGLINEAFITNTSSEVTPVTHLGDTCINGGLPGPITTKLQAQFDTEIRAMRGF